MMSEHDAIPELLPVNHVYSMTEVCCLCEVEEHWVVEIVTQGVIEHPLHEQADQQSHGLVEMYFSHDDLDRLARAIRLQREFEVQVENLALVLDLMDTITQQRQELVVLRQQAGLA